MRGGEGEIHRLWKCGKLGPCKHNAVWVDVKPNGDEVTVCDTHFEYANWHVVHLLEGGAYSATPIALTVDHNLPT